MSHEKTIHILHLTGRALGWVTLENGGGRLRRTGEGRLEGPPEATLADWANGRSLERDAVRLYDGRPRYYSFALNLPGKAHAQFGLAVTLRVREELGLGERDVAWSTRARRRPEAPGIVELFTVVARRGEVDALEKWAAGRGIGSFWVGADIDAVRCLVETGAVEAPALICNRETGGAALYLARTDGAVVKGMIAEGTQANGSLPPELSALTAAGAPEGIGFGAADWQWMAASAPGLGAPRSDRPLRIGSRRGRGSLALEDETLAPGQMDAVLAGGIQDLVARRIGPGGLRWGPAGVCTPMASLAASGDALGAELPLWAQELSRKVKPQMAAMAGLGAALALVFALGGVWLSRSRAYDRLQTEVATLRAASEINRSQQAVMEAVKRERGQALELLRMVMEAAPGGLQIRSIDLSADGGVTMEAVSRNRGDGDTFFQALSNAPLLANVRFPINKPGQNNMMSFQFTAQLKGRGRLAR
jgi:Tfp pilus assembly protein PilN